LEKVRKEMQEAEI